MLAEIEEKHATGDIARIFDEVRRLWGVPYVSAIHRHLATRPGVLEWAWQAVGPAFRSGRAQEAGWQCAAQVQLPPLDRISGDALRVWGVDAEALGAIRHAAESFERVAPVNMMFAGLVKALFEGRQPGTGDLPRLGWTPPSALPVPPGMLAPESLPPAQRGVLLQFATLSDGKPFVPGLYRMLAHWPQLLAHLATVLPPRIESTAAIAACDALRAGIDAKVPEVLAMLPPVEGRWPMPDAPERANFLSIGGTYRKTSPELVIVGRLIRECLP